MSNGNFIKSIKYTIENVKKEFEEKAKLVNSIN